jgi:hypothetical protein
LIDCEQEFIIIGKIIAKTYVELNHVAVEPDLSPVAKPASVEKEPRDGAQAAMQAAFFYKNQEREKFLRR